MFLSFNVGACNEITNTMSLATPSSGNTQDSYSWMSQGVDRYFEGQSMTTHVYVVMSEFCVSFQHQW